MPYVVADHCNAFWSSSPWDPTKLYAPQASILATSHTDMGLVWWPIATWATEGFKLEACLFCHKVNQLH